LAILLVVDEAKNINTTQVLHRPATAQVADIFCNTIFALLRLGNVSYLHCTVTRTGDLLARSYTTPVCPLLVAQSASLALEQPGC
jgi:hypothetical protein